MLVDLNKCVVLQISHLSSSFPLVFFFLTCLLSCFLPRGFVSIPSALLTFLGPGSNKFVFHPFCFHLIVSHLTHLNLNFAWSGLSQKVAISAYDHYRETLRPNQKPWDGSVTQWQSAYSRAWVHTQHKRKKERKLKPKQELGRWHVHVVPATYI